MDKNQPEATRSLRSWGFGTYHPPDVRYGSGGQIRFQEEQGRPDLFVFRGGRMVYVEVKIAATAFPFAHFENSKREYIEKYCKAKPYEMDVWLWLSLGTGNPNANPDKMPRLSWLVPLVEYYAVEDRIKPYQLSLPYRASKGYNIHMQENRLDAVNLLKNFELVWKGAGLWGITPEHPFNKIFIQPNPIPLYTKEGKPNAKRPNVTGLRLAARNVAGYQQHDTGFGFATSEYGLPREGSLPTREYSRPLRPFTQSISRSFIPPMACL